MNKLLFILIGTFTMIFLVGCGERSPNVPIAERLVEPDGIEDTADDRPSARYGSLDGNAGFAEISSEIIENASLRNRCTLERINGEKVIKGRPVSVLAGNEFNFYGWVAGPEFQLPTDFVIVLQGDTSYGLKASPTLKRTDVAKALGAEALAMSGFVVRASSTAVAPGNYSVVILQDVGGSVSKCSTPGFVSVVQ